MKIIFAIIGETHKKWAREGEKEYIERIKHYIDFETLTIPDIKNTKNLSTELQKKQEGQALLAKILPADRVILLDERGTEFTSRGFANFIADNMNKGYRRLVFVVGGPYGFSPEVYGRADKTISFSQFTFPHDLIRVIFAEQLYRAMSILRNEPYHHD